MERKIDLTFVKLVNKKAELYKRNCRAEEYSANARKRLRKGNRLTNFFRKNAREIISSVLICVVIVMLGYGIVEKVNNTEPRYAIASTRQINGEHFIYITERVCEVYEINDDLITVEYQGNLYDFFGDGYEVGETIVCQFTDAMEIVGVVE